MSHSLNACVNCLPGQKDVDMALKSVGEASKKLLVETVSYKQGQFFLFSHHPMCLMLINENASQIL